MKRLISLFVASIIYVCMANAQVDNVSVFVDKLQRVVNLCVGHTYIYNGRNE